MAGGIGSELVIVKLLDPDAGGLHQYPRQCRGDLASLESLQSFETVAVEQQAHLPTRYPRRQIAKLHRLSPERIHYRSENLGACQPRSTLASIPATSPDQRAVCPLPASRTRPDRASSRRRR